MKTILLFLLSLLSKLAPFGASLAAGPLGTIGLAIWKVVTKLASLLWSLVRWTCADIVDAYQEWQRGVARFVCFVIVFCIGGYSGLQWDSYKVDRARDETAQLKREWKTANEDNSRKAAAAESARKQAEEAERGRIAAEQRAKDAEEKAKWAPATNPAAPPPAPKRVRPVPGRPAATPAKSSGGMWESLQAVFGFSS